MKNEQLVLITTASAEAMASNESHGYEYQQLVCSVSQGIWRYFTRQIKESDTSVVTAIFMIALLMHGY